ncbi:MAG TPA: hypothetical protein PLD27_03560 [bacterium]|nr:hypothetical protein [bacterium]HPQ19497.1 hypothetical protein [bacterium]
MVKKILLQPGKYKYQFIVDNNIIPDPENKNFELDKKSMSKISIIEINKIEDEVLTFEKTKEQDLFVVPFKLYYGNYLDQYKLLKIVCENKLTKKREETIAYFNYLDYSYSALLYLPEGIYHYYFTDNNNAFLFNENLPFINDNGINKNTLFVNSRFFKITDKTPNYIADDFIILYNIDNFSLLTLRNDVDEVNILFKILDITFSYPLSKTELNQYYDLFYLEDDISNLKPEKLEFCFTIKDGIYTFYFDEEGLKSEIDDLKFIKY